MNIFDTLQSLNINWEDLPSLLIHADQLEDIGEIRCGQILRWIARTGRIPIRQSSAGNNHVYTWCNWCIFSDNSDSDYIPESVLQCMASIFPNTVTLKFTDISGHLYADFTFLKIAYTTLIYTMLYMKDGCPIKYWESNNE